MSLLGLKMRKLTAGQKRTMAFGAGLISFAAIIKFGYFYLSRTLIMENLEERDREARKYLKESQKFGSWAQKDREKRSIPLTKQQETELQNYLALMAQHNKEVYPMEGDEWKQK